MTDEDEFATLTERPDATDANFSALPGTKIKREIPGYLILKRLGQVGMGAVYLAMDRKLRGKSQLK